MFICSCFLVGDESQKDTYQYGRSHGEHSPRKWYGPIGPITFGTEARVLEGILPVGVATVAVIKMIFHYDSPESF
jgi:hypothetical protein